MFHTVAITGSSGFVGRALTDYFLSKGKYVRGLDMRDRTDVAAGNLFNLTKMNLLQIADHDINLNETNAVIHLAGLSGVVQDDPDHENLIVGYNTALTDTALMMCHDHGISCMINASSSSVYGSATPPFKESEILRPLSQYGISKARSEEVCDQKAQELGIRVFSIRLFNMIGSHQRPNTLPWLALRAAAAMDSPVPLYGVSFRAYTWVNDFARLCHYIIENTDLWPPGHYVFNFGSEASVSQVRLFGEIEKWTKRVVPYSLCQRREGEMEITKPDMSHTKDCLGDFVTAQCLELGVKDVIKSFQRQFRLSDHA